MISIRRVSGSNHGPGRDYLDWVFLIVLVTFRKYRGNTSY